MAILSIKFIIMLVAVLIITVTKLIIDKYANAKLFLVRSDKARYAFFSALAIFISIVGLFIYMTRWVGNTNEIALESAIKMSLWIPGLYALFLKWVELGTIAFIKKIFKIINTFLNKGKITPDILEEILEEEELPIEDKKTAKQIISAIEYLAEVSIIDTEKARSILSSFYSSINKK